MSDTVLAELPGAPPLKEHMVGQLAGMYGWSNGIAITAAQVSDLRARLIEDWTTANEYGVAVAVQGCEVGGDVDKQLADAPASAESMKALLVNWQLDRQVDLRESGYVRWMMDVGLAQPASSESAHDAYIETANTSLAGHIERMRSYGSGDPTRDW